MTSMLRILQIVQFCFLVRIIYSSEQGKIVFISIVKCNFRIIFTLIKRIIYLAIIFLRQEDVCKIVVVMQNGIQSIRNVAH